MNERLRILILDDGADSLQRIRNSLTIKGVALTQSGNAGDAIHALVMDAHDVVILNLNALAVNWIDTYQEIRKLDPGIYIILLSDNELPRHASEIEKNEPRTFMIQSRDEEKLLKTLTLIERKITTSTEKDEDLERLSTNIQNLEEILRLFKTLLKK